MSDVTLHPAMSAQQIAEWCAKHKMFVTIDYVIGADGFCAALISARREPDPDHIPIFLRKQAE